MVRPPAVNDLPVERDHHCRIIFQRTSSVLFTYSITEIFCWQQFWLSDMIVMWRACASACRRLVINYRSVDHDSASPVPPLCALEHPRSPETCFCGEWRGTDLCTQGTGQPDMACEQARDHGALGSGGRCSLRNTSIARDGTAMALIHRWQICAMPVPCPAPARVSKPDHHIRHRDEPRCQAHRVILHE